MAFDLPYAARRYLALSVFTGKLWYIAGTVALPRHIAVKITSEILRLFWSDKAALVKTGKLGLPRQFGGWNITSVTSYSVTYALKSVFRVLSQQTGHPARQPSVYFLGPQARLFLQHMPSGPKANQAPPSYTKVIAPYPPEYQQWEICPKYWTSKTERLQLFQSSYRRKTGCPIPWTTGAAICTVVLKLEVSKRR